MLRNHIPAKASASIGLELIDEVEVKNVPSTGLMEVKLSEAELCAHWWSHCTI